MDVILKVSLMLAPLVLLILVGYAAGATRYYSKSLLPDMMKFFMYFPVPFVTFKSLASMKVSTLVSSEDFAFAFLILIITIAICIYPITRSVGYTHKDASVFALCASSPNLGFVGLPLVLSMPNGHLYLHYWLAMALIATFCMGFIFIPMLKFSQSGNIFKGFVESVVTSFKEPLVFSAVCGFIFSFFSIGLPVDVHHYFSLVDSSLSGIGLICIGMTVTFGFLRTRSTIVWFLIFVKGLVMPLLAYVIGFFIMNMSKEALFIFVVLASCPAAGTSVVLAYQNTDVGDQVSQAMVGTVLLCFLSISLCYVLI